MYTTLYYNLKVDNKYRVNEYSRDFYLFENDKIDIMISLPGDRKISNISIENLNSDSLVVTNFDYRLFGKEGELKQNREYYQLNKAGSSIPGFIDFNKEKVVVEKGKYFMIQRDFRNRYLRKNKELTVEVVAELIIDGELFHVEEKFLIEQHIYKGWYIGLD
jgi:hypothetical protein